MIIIKSQDGLIGEWKTIAPNLLDKTEIIAIKEVFIVDYQNKLNRTEGWILIGKYETEEKAKEVMEDIEDHIRHAYVHDMIKNVTSMDMTITSFIDVYDMLEHHKEVAIFTMPKE